MSTEDTAYIKVAVPRDKKDKAEKHCRDVHGVSLNQYLKQEVYTLAHKEEKGGW